MHYSTTNPHAVHHPLRSIPLIRPASILGTAFAAQFDRAGLARAAATRAVEMSRFVLTGAESAHEAARGRIRETNRMRRRDRHDRAIVSDRQVARLHAEAFRVLNRSRGELVRARRALAAAEAVLAGMTN